ncbi:MAG: pilus assembly protein CpaF [Gemmatimonas sp. SG8_28]|nr:MAG: pilus assembly protein CpaF [Gemmatimonas sp. SG8_28]
MALRERLATGKAAPQTTGAAPQGSMARRSSSEIRLSPFDRMKVEIHRKVIDELDHDALNELADNGMIADEVRRLVAKVVQDQTIHLDTTRRESIVEELLHEITGLGPLEPLFVDPLITDILVNGPHKVHVERRGKLEPADVQFRDDAHLMTIIDRIVSRIGRRVDESSPMVDARLPDGSRVNAIIPPLALDGPMVSIRRFGARPLNADDLVGNQTLTEPMLYLLEGCVKARLNVLISGGTGSGKTTLLNALSRYIPSSERILTIEDAAELQLQQEHVVRLETRPPNSEGKGEVVQRDLVKNALRMRPDRIIVGEVRGAEALDMLQAMNTGHEGSLTTIHANSPRDALSRLETMILMAGTNLPDRAMREQIASALDVVIQVSRLSDGSRRLVSISEITGMEGEVVSMQEIYQYERLGLSPEGMVVGRFRPTGIRPAFARKLEVSGINLPTEMFERAA